MLWHEWGVEAQLCSREVLECMIILEILIRFVIWYALM